MFRRDHYRSRTPAEDQDVAVAAQNFELADLARSSGSSRLLQWLPFTFVRPLVVVGDFLAILCSSVLSGVAYHLFFLNTEGRISVFFAVGALVSVNFCAFSGTQQNYSPVNLANFVKQVRFVTLNWLIIFAMLTMVAFTLKITADFSRGATLLFFVTGWASLIVFRAFLAETLTQAWRAGAFSKQRYILVAEQGQSLKSPALTELYRCGYRPAQILEVGLPELNSTSADSSLAKKVEDLCAANQAEPVSCIFVMMQWVRSRKIAHLMQLLRALPVPVYLLPDEYIGSFLAGHLETIGTTRAVQLQRAPLSKIEQTVKRVIDVLIAGIVLVILFPLLLMTALIIKLDSDGPVIFRQRRNGFNGSTFFMYKFRTMHVLEDGERIIQASRNDPRVTRVGGWLRQLSLDELPQLFNVLRGDMSLIGPRPHALAHHKHYQDLVANYAFRHHVKPGITGWAQVNGLRGETPTVDSMAERIKHDLWYIDHWSLWLDLKIFFRTVLIVLLGKIQQGAY
jgi:undecaprenyl-phosphate galactose phosphotransferase/putative colanic acid biosynthesis UDP-glucose lipid carrier transferase